MASNKDFFSPRFTGPRFEDHTLPVNILEDFTAFEELIFDLAKNVFLEKNPNRKRVPKGFTDNVYLKLSGIQEGSTILTFLISTIPNNSPTIFPSENTDYFGYFEEARDKVFNVIEEANSDGSINLGSKYLDYFNKIGKNLEEGESIYLLDHSERTVVFTRSTRRKILLSRAEKIEYSEIIQENILIPSIDKRTKKFYIELNNGKVFEHYLDPEFTDTITNAFSEYEKKTLVSIKAIGVYNKNNDLILIEKIESMDILDPFDVSVRLNELSKLENKWFNGIDGKALNKEQINTFESYFESYFRADLALPAIFPTISGDIVLEWKKGNIEISLEVNLSNMTAQLFYFNMEDDNEDYENTLDLKKEEYWQKINLAISSI